MTDRRVVLLRGINLGPRNRVAMPELREALSEAGYAGVRTYVQSGNVVLDSAEAPTELEARCERLIDERFGLSIPVVVRSRDELAAVVKSNPLRRVASEPKRYQVSFLAEALEPDQVKQLEALATGGERLVARGRELYAWHPNGVARSKLWAALAGTGLRTKATARNWNTVETLLAMASE
ncbi:MAG TPA: DUF1697 domain-containing protein [Solirubrobacteraceae bacterium]|nr:DUF1697 domain-containing protein [Solirubrobacteraceae bacterium]